jgi:hypothetical protein
MKNKLVLAMLVAVAPGIAMAAGENNVGSCGGGSKLFDGQKGIAPQVMAATTNIPSQTFGITSGTMGCTQDGIVKSAWKTAMFIDGNKEQLARDMSIGSGESLDSLASLIGVREEHKAAFHLSAKQNFGRIFASDSVTTPQVLASLKQVLAENSELSGYAAAI